MLAKTLFLSAALSAASLGAVNAAPNSNIPSHPTTSSIASLRGDMQELRDSYMALDQAAVRGRIFTMLMGLNPTDGTAPLLKLAQASLEEGAAGGIDGIETILLYAMDGIYTLGSPNDISDLQSLLAANSNQVYLIESPNSALILPLGQYGTAVYRDLRADSVRVFTKYLVNGGPMPINGLNGLPGVPFIRSELCAQEMRGASVRGLLVREGQSDLDQAMDSRYCDELSGGAGDLPEISAGGCFDPTALLGETDRLVGYYQEMQRLQEDCVESMHSSAQGAGSLQSGTGVATAVATAEKTVEIAEKAGLLDEIIAAVKSWWSGEEVLTPQQRAVAIASERVRALDKDIGKLDIEIKVEEKALALDYGESPGAVIEIMTKQLARKVNTRKEKAKERAYYDKKMYDAQIGRFSPNDPFAVFDSPECRELMEFRHAHGTKLGRDIVDQIMGSDPASGVDPIVSRWSSDSDQGIEDEPGLMPCGSDPATSSPGGMSCEGLILCGPEDLHCACADTNMTTIGDTAGAFAARADMLCTTLMTCTDGSAPMMSGAGCVCNGDEEIPDFDDDFGPMSGGFPSN